MLTWQTEKRKISELNPAPYNPRRLTEKQAKDLGISLERFNLAEPIVINIDNTIIGGHQRIKILKEKYGNDGFEVDVRVPSRMLTKEEEKELNLRLNKNLGEFDLDALANFDEKLLGEVGFESEELDKIFQLDVPDEDTTPEVRQTDIKLGDMFQLGEHRLLCGDATKREDVERLMAGEKADMVFTSPPYNMAGNLYSNYADNLKSEKFIELHLNAINNVKRFLQGFIFWNVSYNKNARWEFIEILFRIIKETGLRFLELIVWDKGHGLPITSQEGLTRNYEEVLLVGEDENIQKDLEIFALGTTEKKAYFNRKTQKGISNYWRIGTDNSQIQNLKACFPVALPERGILLMTVRGEKVIDVFGGSGSTLIACEKLNRKCYMMEIDPVYVDVIIRRWEDYTGQKAVKLEN